MYVCVYIYVYIYLYVCMHVCIYRTSRCLARHPYIGKMKSSFTTTLNVEKLTLLRMMYSLSPLSSGKFSSGMKCSFTTTLSVLLTSPPYIGKMSRNFMNSKSSWSPGRASRFWRRFSDSPSRSRNILFCCSWFLAWASLAISCGSSQLWWTLPMQPHVSSSSWSPNHFSARQVSETEET